VVEDRDQASESEQGKLLYSEQRRTDSKKADHAATSKDGQEWRRRPRGGKKTKTKGDHTRGVADPNPCGRKSTSPDPDPCRRWSVLPDPDPCGRSSASPDPDPCGRGPPRSISA